MAVTSWQQYGPWLGDGKCRVCSGCRASTRRVTCDSCTQVVKERLLCHAIVGREGRKRQIMHMDVTCEFIAPVLQMSSRAITFRVEKVSLGTASWHLIAWPRPESLWGACACAQGGNERASPSQRRDFFFNFSQVKLR